MGDEPTECEPTEGELPEEAVETAERLTRLARAATDDAERAAYREERASVLDEHGFTARLRDEADGDVLVLHPDEWLEDGLVRRGRIEDTDRAVEIPLSGAGDPEDWDALAAHNDGIVARVAAEHGETHAANARAFADFMSNHYARPIESVTDEETAEFLGEYYPRNAWPTPEQEAVVETSVALVREAAEAGTTGDEATDAGTTADDTLSEPSTGSDREP